MVLFRGLLRRLCLIGLVRKQAVKAFKALLIVGNCLARFYLFPPDRSTTTASPMGIRVMTNIHAGLKCLSSPSSATLQSAVPTAVDALRRTISLRLEHLHRHTRSLTTAERGLTGSKATAYGVYVATAVFMAVIGILLLACSTARWNVDAMAPRGPRNLSRSSRAQMQQCETNFGVISLAAPNAASSKVARYGAARALTKTCLLPFGGLCTPTYRVGVDA
jgi:hypothetical protein